MPDDKQPTQAMPTTDDGEHETAEDASGRTRGGESGGGPYKDPDQVEPDPDSPGGQTHQAYSGPGDAQDGGDNPNAVSRG